MKRLVPGILLLILAIQGTGLAAKPRGVPERPGILLVSLDTLRADVLASLGGDRARTPVVDRLSREGVLFSGGRTPSPWTLPAHGSLFSGLLPLDHGLTVRYDLLAPEVPWLPERLREAGYRTAAYTGGGFVSNVHAMERGFGTWEEFMPGHRAVERSLEWLARQGDKSFFLFLHTFEIHDYFRRLPRHLRRVPRNRELSAWLPHLPLLEVIRSDRARQLGPEDVAYLRDLYRAGLEESDRLLGDLLRGLRRLGLVDRTILVILSDHGEAFGEHGLFHHGTSLHEELSRVPLLLVGPGMPHGRIVTEPFDLTDLPGWIADLAGVRWRTARGPSLWRVLRGAGGRSRPLFAEDRGARLFSRTQDGWKLTLAPLGTIWHWSHLALDPAERGLGLRPPFRERAWRRSLLERFYRSYEGRLVTILRGTDGPGRVRIRFLDVGMALPERTPSGGDGDLDVDRPGQLVLATPLEGAREAVSFLPGSRHVDLVITLDAAAWPASEPGLQIMLGPDRQPWGGRREIPFRHLAVNASDPPESDLRQPGLWIFWVPGDSSRLRSFSMARLDEEQLERLAALGYTDAAPVAPPSDTASLGRQGEPEMLRLRLRRADPSSPGPIRSDSKEAVPVDASPDAEDDPK